MKVLIIGGVAGGATAAARLRRHNEEAEIIVFEKDSYISFANCGLPYYVGGVIEKREALILQSPESMKARFNIDVRVRNEVLSIDTKAKTVKVLDRDSNKEYEESYDKLIMSPGANPIVPPTKGADEADNIFSIRNIHDIDKVKEYVTTKKPKTAVVIGAGFIGVEMAENLAHIGVKTSIVNLADQVLAPFDGEMASILHHEIRAKKVDLILGDKVVEFKDKGKTLITDKGQTLKADIVIMAIGVFPMTKLAQDAGIKCLDKAPGGIIVNDKMETSSKDVYACGDAALTKSSVDGEPTRIALAWPANRQAIIIADQIAGIDTRYNGSMGTSVIQVFDYTASCTGFNEGMLKRKGVDYKVTYSIRPNHVTYYPGAEYIHTKLLWCPKTGKILGAQAIGKKAVERRIDVIATAMLGGLTVSQLPELELAYAPPFGAAKDPVNIAGYVAKNAFDKFVEIVSPAEYDEVSKDGIRLDVRTPAEYKEGHIESAINIEVDTLRANLDKLDKSKTIFVNCQSGHRSYVAVRLLVNLGYKAVNLTGGYEMYWYNKNR